MIISIVSKKKGNSTVHQFRFYYEKYSIDSKSYLYIFWVNAFLKFVAVFLESIELRELNLAFFWKMLHELHISPYSHYVIFFI